ncbi:hypothetical protein AMTR_s00010p00258310 [Amborella trichopoda]|uniref:Uncharacterized protein n=1 Tax=Amborella trichopoda TaxID=13333 RepID=W1NGZ0_AMBTC|nr:hypothetical protein AMTR_s00010p00258310 [Amborella trichopoda]
MQSVTDVHLYVLAALSLYTLCERKACSPSPLSQRKGYCQEADDSTMAIHTSSYESFSAHGSHKQDYFDPRFRRGRIVKSMMFPIVAFMIVVLLLTYMSFISKRFHIHGKILAIDNDFVNFTIISG